MSELLDYVSFQRRVCENQLKSYNKILNESHPKYKLLKEEYEFYLLMENIVKSLENQNVTSDQIDDATKILQDILNQFKSSLSSLNEVDMSSMWNAAKGAVGKAAKGVKSFVQGTVGGGHNIDDLAKEKSVQNFTQVYQSFKPLLQAANIIDGMIDKSQQQGGTFNSEILKPLKLSGSMGAELKNLILKAASNDQGIQKLKSSLEIVQNYGQSSTNPILSNFIPNDLVNNSIDVGIKSSFGSAPLRGHASNKPTGWMKDVEGELGGESPVVNTEPSTQLQQDKATFGGSSMFSGMQHEPEHDVDLSDLDNSPKLNKKANVRGGTFRNVATTLEIPGPVITSMVKSGAAGWAAKNPEKFKQLADQFLQAVKNGTVTSLKESNEFIAKFIENCENEKKLVTEVVNKWNKLAGIK